MENKDLILNENISTDISRIINCSTHIYSHLMKITMVTPISDSWIRTVAEQSRQLAKINNTSYWKAVTEDSSKMSKIRNNAIAEYTKDHNKDAETAFNLVYQEFSNIILFQQWTCLKDYIIKIANRNGDTRIAKYAAEYRN